MLALEKTENYGGGGRGDEVSDGIDIMHPHLSIREQGAATDQED